MPGGEELQAPCLAASEEDLLGHLPDLTWDPPRAGNHLDPLMEAWLKRGVHSPVASLSSFVDYRETINWVQEMITDLACFKLAPVTTVYAVSRPAPPPSPYRLHFLSLRWRPLTLNVTQVGSFQSLEAPFQPLCTWPTAP